MYIDPIIFKECVETGFSDLFSQHHFFLKNEEENKLTYANGSVNLTLSTSGYDALVFTHLKDLKTGKSYTLTELRSFLARDYPIHVQKWPKNKYDSIRFHINIIRDILINRFSELLDGDFTSLVSNNAYRKFQKDYEKKKKIVMSMPQDDPVFQKYITDDLTWYDDIRARLQQ